MRRRLTRGRLGLAAFCGLGVWTCAKAEDQAPHLPGQTSTTGTRPGTGNNGSSNNGSSTSSSSTTRASGNSTTSGAGGAPGEGGASASGGTSNEGGSGGVPQEVIDNADLVLLYKVNEARESSSSVFAHLYLRNQSNESFPLGAAEVRYWFDSDGLGFTQASHYQGPLVGSVTLALSEADGEEYIAITFEPDRTLPARTGDINSTEFQLKLDAASGMFDQTNDFSFAPQLTTITEHDRVTVYLAGHLIWGCEPSGTCAKDVGAGGAAGAAGAAGAPN